MTRAQNGHGLPGWVFPDETPGSDIATGAWEIGLAPRLQQLELLVRADLPSARKSGNPYESQRHHAVWGKQRSETVMGADSHRTAPVHRWTINTWLTSLGNSKFLRILRNSVPHCTNYTRSNLTGFTNSPRPGAGPSQSPPWRSHSRAHTRSSWLR